MTNSKSQINSNCQAQMTKTPLTRPSPHRDCVVIGGKRPARHSERSEESHRINRLENRDSSAVASE
jgi:hypothetical protein